MSDSIVLLAKQPGLTSFSSLRNVKKAMNTTKVGHTGTLDSFAEGLLVVCTGHYTKLCGQITAFDKSYEAVIHFGSETDTLEYTGSVIKNAPFPSEEDLKKAVEKWTGPVMQKPPAFSAIHVDGKRASDLVREGKSVDIEERPVTIFSSEITEIKYAEASDEKLVEYAKIRFSVSKGTYIRSLARDIAESCGTAGYLTGLFRTRVGNFRVEDAAGYSFLENFNIENACKKEAEYKASLKDLPVTKSKKADKPQELQLQKEIWDLRQDVTFDLAKTCGFETVNLANKIAADSFKNGKPIRSSMFDKSLWDFPNECTVAVFERDEFMDDEDFVGLINKNAEGKVSYGFVIN